MKSLLKASIALLLAASSLAPAMAQTNPDPWMNPWVEPYASNLAQLMQLAGTDVFDPDLKAKIQALGPTVQVVDVPMGFNYFYDGFEQDAPTDNFYYLRDQYFRVNNPRHPFGTGPLTRWQDFNGAGLPVILNVDGNGPLGEYDPGSSGLFGIGQQDSYRWYYNRFDATSSDGVGHYAANLGNPANHPHLAYFGAVPQAGAIVKMVAKFTATCGGPAQLSSYWTKWASEPAAGQNTDNPGGPYLPNNSEIYAKIHSVNPDGSIGSLIPQNNLGLSVEGNSTWMREKSNFTAVKGTTYAIEIQLLGWPDSGTRRMLAVDDVSVVNLQTCTKTIPNLFYKPPNTGPNIGGLDLSNVTMEQAVAVNPKVIFDPKSTIYFPPTDPQIGPGACCGPFSEKDIPNLLVPVFPNGANSAYTMQYAPNTALDAQMAAYLNYVHSQDPTITTITIDWSAANLGSGATPASYGPFVPGASGQSVTWTWTPNGVTNNGGNFWTGAPFSINSWYGFMTKISHNGTPDSPLFGANCVQNWWKFRVQGTNKIMSPRGNSGPLTYQAVGSDGRVRAIERKPAPRSIR